MNETLILDPLFRTVGIASFTASLVALLCSIGHAWFYWTQRARQPDEFMRGLACRMKALFTVMSAMFLLDLVSGYGLMVNYTMMTWLWICAIKAGISLSYVAALFWLYAFYRRPNV